MRGAGLVVIALVVVGPSRAQEEFACEPLRVASVPGLVERLGLDADQAEWLVGALRAGRVRSPDDLWGLPGAGSELRDELAAGFCWDEIAGGELTTATRRREGASLVDARARGEGAGWDGVFRWRRDDRGETTLRGGGRLRRGRWALAGGTLRARRALGLLVETPGAESRGHVPGTWSTGRWTPTRAVDPAIGTGVALRRDGPVAVWGAGLADRLDSDAVGTWGAAGVETRLGRIGVELTGRRFRGKNAGSLGLTGPLGPGTWGLEWAGVPGGWARAVLWGGRLGAWTVSGRLAALDPGFAAPTGDGPASPEPEGSTSLRLASRWTLGTGRFLRLGLEGERRSRERGGWSDTGERLEIEVGESWGRGWGVALLWRRVANASLGAPTSAVSRTLRGELRRTRHPWTVTLRLEERADDAGRGSLATLRLAHGGRVAWEIRGAHAAGEGRDPGLFWYRRRAGGLYGWDRVPAGAWAGGWLRWPLGPLRGEASLDARAGGYEASVALTVRVGAGD